MIAKEEECAAVKITAAGPGHNIERTPGADPGRKVEVRRRQLKLPHDLLREILLCSARRCIRNRDAIDSNANGILAGIGPQDIDIELVIGQPKAVCRDRYARLQKGQLQEISSIQREV